LNDNSDVEKNVPSATNKIEHTSLFSSISSVSSCLYISNHEGDAANIFSNPGTSFVVTLNTPKKDTWAFRCPTPEQRDAWVDAFGHGVISAWEMSSKPEALHLRTKLGWQHCVVRSSFSTFVINDDVAALKRAFHQQKVSEVVRVCLGHQEHRRDQHALTKDLNKLDSYNGFAALHYAALIGSSHCPEVIRVLLAMGSKIDLEDRNGVLPMTHGKSENRTLTVVLFDCLTTRYLRLLNANTFFTTLKLCVPVMMQLPIPSSSTRQTRVTL